MTRWPSVPVAVWASVFTWTLGHWATPAYASPSQLKEANRQFNNGHYDKALQLYEDALIDKPFSSVLKYNAGAASYQSGDFSKAGRYFQDADEHGTKELRQAAFYNRGNALYKEGRLADAIESYKKALRLNPGDEAARYNLSVALMAQNNPQQNPNAQPKSGGGKDEKKNNDDQSKEKDNDSQTDAQDKAPQPKPGQMSKEDAERLLDAAAAGEIKKSNQPPQKAGKGTDEDW